MTANPWSLARLGEPLPFLSVSAAKQHLRIPASITAEDDLIEQQLRGAERALEADLGISLGLTEWELRLDRFPGLTPIVYLPRPPLRSVESIVYLSPTDETETTVDPDDYRTVLGGRGLAVSTPGFVYPVLGSSWPVPHDSPQAVRIKYSAGFYDQSATQGATPADDPVVPDLIRVAVLMLLAEMHEQREITLTGTISSQLPLYERLAGEYRCLQEPCYD